MSQIPLPSPQIPLLFFLLSSLPFLGNSQPQSNEQTILLNLKQKWKNPPLISSWDLFNGSNHCTWPSVTCNGGGSVTELLLPNANITDPIPPFICELKNLTVLNLSFNYIPGEFPTFLYNCSNLQVLDLSQNYFVGPIPSDINRMSTLRYLSLAANNFSGDIPESISNLKELRVLHLYMNLFNGSVPPAIGNLLNLEELNLATNGFVPSKIPLEFGQLRKLRHLEMTEANLIGEIPEIFYNLTGLEYLDLGANNLSGMLPRSLFSLKNLTLLYLFQNRLSGQIPTPVELFNLKRIDLSMNELTGSVPQDFGNLQSLIRLFLYANKLTGELPASIGKLPNLIEIRLFMNKFSGVLPPELGLHSKLEELQVSDNQFSGNLPDNLCNGGVLVGIVAFKNNLSGGLPRSLEKCDSLMVVQLYNNRFSGLVPYSFWSLKNLSTVIISNNSFSGDLPETLPWNLSRLVIDNNRFSGKIPSKIMSAKNLVVFVGSNNFFSGNIPLELTALPQLATLFLDGNQLSGPIPANIISWGSLTTLNLSRNQLSGEIPLALAKLPDLTQLDLSENQFSGRIPFEIGQLKLNSLNLSSNKLTGKLPFTFDNPVFDNSFLNNSGLCTDNPLLKINPCFSKTSQQSRKLSSGFLAMILVLSAAILMSVALFAFFVFKDYQRRKQISDLSSWKLTSFQRLDFTESNIVSNLTEDNLIGSGGSGEVYRVAVNRSDHHVAVKKTWSDAKLDQNLEKEFLAEVQILGTIRHYNIVKLLCCISNEKSKFLVYEYVQNRSLDLWLHGKKGGSLVSSSVRHSTLDWPVRMRIAIGAAQGLSYMHHNCSPPIIHRDVKSSNILLDSEFNAKIADFGLARMLHKRGELNTMSVIAGSFGYIAPEYAHSTKVNEKIDVYSFGVVLLELVTGREANDGDEDTCLAEQAWRHYQDGKSIESAVDEEVKEPSYLEEMCMVFKLGLMCTATLPSTRPSMKEVLQILLWRGPLQACGEKKAQNENDVAPLLSDKTEYRASDKSKRWDRTSDDDEDDSSFTSNV